MKSVELKNDTWSIALLPEWGGRVAYLKAKELDIVTPINSDSFDPFAWPRGGIYPLMPYSNRIRDSRLVHEGVTHSLPIHRAAKPHTLHGVAHTLAWQVTEQTQESVTLTCLYEGEHWPWPVRFEQRFSLRDELLLINLGVTNLGKTPMPAGLGLHPYFHRHPGMRVEMNIERSWEIDSDYLPTGTSQVGHQAIVIDDDLQNELAVYGSQWDGVLSVDYSEGRLRMVTNAPLTHFVAFAPVDAPYLCLEPVSHLADAFNAPQSAWADQGTQVLAPEQTLTATVSFAWQSA